MKQAERTYTPGPWTAMEGSDDRIRIEAVGLGPEDAITYGSVVSYCGLRSGLEEQKANALLMAAAPELFEALEFMAAEVSRVRTIDDIGPHSGLWVAWSRANAALKKAREGR